MPILRWDIQESRTKKNLVDRKVVDSKQRHKKRFAIFYVGESLNLSHNVVEFEP